MRVSGAFSKLINMSYFCRDLLEYYLFGVNSNYLLALILCCASQMNSLMGYVDAPSFYYFYLSFFPHLFSCLCLFSIPLTHQLSLFFYFYYLPYNIIHSHFNKLTAKLAEQTEQKILYFFLTYKSGPAEIWTPDLPIISRALQPG